MSIKRRKKELEKIKKESEKMILSYLDRHYNINSINDMRVRFDDEGSGLGNSYKNKTDYVTATFTNGDKEHIIICNYTTEKCYDTYAYETKVNPILVNEIERNLKTYGITENCKPEYVNIRLENMTRFLSWDYYGTFQTKYFGVFDNGAKVSNYKEIITYYNQIESNDKIYSIDILYNTNKIISNNIDAYKKLGENLNEKYNVYNYYSNDIYEKHGIYNEVFYGNAKTKEYAFEFNNKMEYKNYITSWVIEECELNESQSKKYQDFIVSIVQNDNTFENEIEYQKQKYYLYNNEILNVINPSEHRKTINIFKNASCKGGEIIYKDKFNEINLLYNSYTFDYNESSQKFAIYCPRD